MEHSPHSRLIHPVDGTSYGLGQRHRYLLWWENSDLGLQRHHRQSLERPQGSKCYHTTVSHVLELDPLQCTSRVRWTSVLSPLQCFTWHFVYWNYFKLTISSRFPKDMEMKIISSFPGFLHVHVANAQGLREGVGIRSWKRTGRFGWTWSSDIPVGRQYFDGWDVNALSELKLIFCKVC